MLEILNINSNKAQEKLKNLLNRQFYLSLEHEETVKNIINDIKENGDNALVQYNKRFDSPDFTIEKLVVTSEEIEKAYKIVSDDILKTLKRAIKNIEDFHFEQKSKSWFKTKENGVILGQLVRPVDRAGIYVPGGQGGKTPLVSSVIMGVAPARIAGVGEIYLATPPDKEGNINPYLTVAANECGATKIFKAGSAWAIAALALGTENIPKVDVIAGPGNIYVTLAKKILSGIVGIDMIAGPSEVLIIADNDANPAYIAADMLSQAEHDPLATSILITTSEKLASQVTEQIDTQLKTLSRNNIAMKSLKNNGTVFVVEDILQAADISNRLAPEHLELMVKSPWELLPLIKHAGAIFMGENSPEPLGDYFAGPNHVLPTMGTARFSSALSVDTFIKKSSIISYSEKGLKEDAPDVIKIAGLEGLDAHLMSIKKRITP